MVSCNYFAYGSNMSPKRLQKRVPSAKIIGVYSLAEHKLRFHKFGQDGSAKCDAWYTGSNSNFVLGVLYSIEIKEKILLDNVEGLGRGYREKEVHLINSVGGCATGYLYYATNIKKNIFPFSWYVHHVLQGAKIAGLPLDYIQQITAVETIEDPDSKRNALELSIYKN